MKLKSLKSFSILNDVVKNINLNLFVEGVGEITSRRVLDYPFKIKIKIL